MKGTIMRLWSARGFRTWGTIPVLLVLIGLSGCGSSTATVSGKVSYKGNPLKGGNITFASAEGKPSVSTSIDENGTYTCKAPTGKVKVSVETASLKPAMAGGKAPKYSPPAGQTSPYQSGDTSDLSKRYTEIPETYSDPEKSGLSYEIKGGSQTIDIELK
jgi:hypothetical protein